MSKRVSYFWVNMLLAFQLLIFVHTNIIAQDDSYDRKKDSLLTLLEISPDRVKSKIYGTLSDLMLNTDTSQAKAFASRAFAYAEMFRAPFDLAQSHYRLGRILFFQDSMEKAMFHLEKSLAISIDKEDPRASESEYPKLSGKSLFYKARIHQQLYPDSTKKILVDLLQALAKLNGSKEDKMIAGINQMIGGQYFKVTMYDEGLKYFQKALEGYKMLGDKRNMAVIYTEMLYRVDRTTSLDYAQKAIDLYAETGDSLSMARNLINISYNTRNILDTETNLGYLQLAYDIFKKHNHFSGMVYALFHLATYHSYHLGDSATELHYLKKGADIALSHAVIKDAGYIFITLGDFYKEQHQYDSAAYYLYIADSITSLMPENAERLYYLVRMGDFLNATGRYDEAGGYQMKALRQAEKINDWQITDIAYDALYRTFKNQGDYKKALSFFEQHRDLINRMINQSTEKKIAELQIRYETEKMENQLTLMKKEQELKNQQLRKREITILSISAGLLLFLIFSGLIVYQLIKKHRAYNKLMEKNLELLKLDKSSSKKPGNNNHKSLPLNPGLQEQILKKLKYQIKQNKIFLKNDLTLNVLAKKCQTNSSYLSRIIHDKYDTNFSGFINELRIREAQKLLADENYRSYSIEGIATSVGFKTKSVFNASFKKFTGVTPTYYLEYLNRSEVSESKK